MNQKPLWKYALSILGAHVGGVVIAAILVISVLPISNNIVFQFCCGVFVLFVYWGLVSGVAWKIGNDDLNRVHFKRMEKNLWRGVWIGLIASIPMFVMGLALVVLAIFDFGSISEMWGMVVYRVLNMHYMVFINLVTDTQSNLKDLPLWQPILICLMNLFTVLCVQSGYLLGFKDIVLMDKLMYKNKSNKKK